MNGNTRLALGAVAVLAVAVGGLVLLRPGSSDPGSAVGGPTASPTESPAPSPTESPAPAPTGTLDTSDWVDYQSAQYGFTIGHPDDWDFTTATRAWTEADAAPGWDTTSQDIFTSPDGTVAVSAWETRYPAATTGGGTPIDLEAWAVDYCELTLNSDCAGIPERAVPLCLERADCHPGLLVPFKDDVQAFFTLDSPGEPVTVVALWHPELAPLTARYGGSTRLLEAFLSTMNVWPKDQ